MPTGGYYLVGAMGLVLVLLAVLQYLRRKNPIQLGIVLLSIGAYLALVAYLHQQPLSVEAKGPEEGPRFWATIAALLVCIILGMLADAMYSWLGKTPAQRRKPIDWPSMIKPLFISPLILIPTVGAFQNAKIDLTRLGFAWLMILLTAFEKGFLWRHYLRKPVGEVPSASNHG